MDREHLYEHRIVKPNPEYEIDKDRNAEDELRREYVRPLDPKMRPCCQCRTMFMSDSKANRFCPDCDKLRPSYSRRVCNSWNPTEKRAVEY